MEEMRRKDFSYSERGVMKNHEARNFSDPLPELEIETEYNFPEIAKLENSFVALLGKIKKEIDENRWGALISDDGGGRIPTLVLRKIIEARTGASPQTFFIAGGRYTPEMKDGEKQDIFVEYLKGIRNKIGEARVLLTTQYIESGTSMLRIAFHMHRAGFENVDIATLSTSRLYDSIADFKVYSASPQQETLKNKHERLSGVEKNWREYQPYPMSNAQAIEHQGRILPFERILEIFDIDPETDTRESAIEKRRDSVKVAEYDKERFSPLTQEEQERIQRDIRLARADINLLVKNVIERVWDK